jgi:hypothetical protein
MATAKKPKITATGETKKSAPRRKTANTSAQQAPAAAARTRQAAPKAEPTPEVESQEIERLAYQLWEQRGRPEGTSVEDWNRAQEILLQSR